MKKGKRFIKRGTVAVTFKGGASMERGCGALCRQGLIALYTRKHQDKPTTWRAARRINETMPINIIIQCIMCIYIYLLSCIFYTSLVPVLGITSPWLCLVRPSFVKEQ